MALARSLKENAPTYILVNNQVPVLQDVQKQIQKNYEKTDLELHHFKLYKLK